MHVGRAMQCRKIGTKTLDVRRCASAFQSEPTKIDFILVFSEKSGRFLQNGTLSTEKLTQCRESRKIVNKKPPNGPYSALRTSSLSFIPNAHASA